MTKIILFLAFFVSLGLVSQNKEKTISLEFSNLTKKEIFSLIEEKTNYHFFYIENWLDEEKLNSAYIDKNINYILNDILKNTTLNFLIIEGDKIIITKGKRIHKSLYDEEETEIISTEISIPFYVQNSSEKDKEVVVIGKETLKSDQKNYSISGIIKNIETNKPVEGIVVLERSKNISGTTDNNGFF